MSSFCALVLTMSALVRVWCVCRWWTVFWDVFIARNQKDGHRNLFAEGYADVSRRLRTQD